MDTKKNIQGTVLASLAVVLLGGCVNTVPVKQVHQNTAYYLNTHFSPGQLREQVRKMVRTNDTGTLNFKKLHVTESVHHKSTDGDKDWSSRYDIHLENAGGPFVMERVEIAANGVPIVDYFSTSYRGFINLKVQRARLSAATTGFSIELKQVKRFDAMSPNAKHLVYSYMTGTGPQLFNFHEALDKCTVGAPYAASKLNAALTDTARDIRCDHFNDNGVKTGTWAYAYLDSYGTALLTSVKDAGGSTSYAIDSIDTH